MWKPAVVTLALLAFTVTTSGSATAAESVGSATLVKTAVNGDYGAIAVRTPVHKDERIRTSQTGLGEFRFKDGTKLAVGAGSSVVIDEFVYDTNSSVQNLTIKAAKGTFRWISGGSKSSAYNIKTPAGTIGVRGTKFDFYVGPDGTTAVVLLNGAAQFCGAGGCVSLRRSCDCVITRPGRRPEASKAGPATLAALGNSRALPFLSGDQRLSGAFGASTGCGMAKQQVKSTNPKQKAQQKAATPRTPNQPTPQSPPNNPPNNPPSNPPTKRGHGLGDQNHTHQHNPQGWGKGGNSNKGGNSVGLSQR